MGFAGDEVTNAAVIEDELELEFKEVGGRLGILSLGLIAVIGGVTNGGLSLFVLL